MLIVAFSSEEEFKWFHYYSESRLMEWGSSARNSSAQKKRRMSRFFIFEKKNIFIQWKPLNVITLVQS
jgi:hypothetical protein